jgi:LysR family transcriptional regulator, glycine cleavage system transcriptional activator
MSRRLPPLNALIAFEAAARHGRMTDAANELCVTPGAVSRQVKNLERSLGLPLFEGTKNRPVLTTAGQTLAPNLSLAFDHLFSAVQMVSALEVSTLQVACYNTLAAKWLLPRLTQLTTQHPKMDVQLSAMTHVDAKLLKTHDAVLLAQAADCGVDAGMKSTMLFEEALGPVLSIELYERSNIRSPRDILKLPLLHTHTRGEAWMTWLKAHHLTLPAIRQKTAARPFQHYYFSLEATLRGQGACVAPFHLVMDDLAAGRLVAPLGFVPSGLNYVLLTSAKPRPIVKDFSNWLLSEASQANTGSTTRQAPHLPLRS